MEKMIYLLFLTLSILFFLCYVFSGRDLFSPATVQILTFAVSVFMCIYFMWSVDAQHEFHKETIIIIVSAMIITAIISIAVYNSISRVEIQAHTPECVEISPIPGKHFLFFGGIILFTVVWLLIEIRHIGGTRGTFFDTMKRFHDINSYSTDASGRLPWFLNQLISLLRVLFLIFGFNLIRFYDSFTVIQKCANFLVLGLCGLGLLLTGGRTPLVNQLICCFIMYHLLRIQKEGGYKPYHMKALAHAFLVLVLVLVGFFLTKRFVGRDSRNNTMNPADYISYYTGSQYIALDQYFQYPPYASNIIGKETFYTFNQFLINYNLVDTPPYIVHLEFRPVGAGFTNNVYTFLRAYHHDFGMVGTFVLHGLSVLFLSVFYEYVKKKRGNLGILILGQMYYTIVMSFFAERFYSSLFSVNYIKQFMILTVLYELFIRKRIRFKFHRTVHRLVLS